MQPASNITAGRVSWFLGTLKRWAQPLAEEEALAVTPGSKLILPKTAFGRWIHYSGSKSGQIPLGLAEGCPLCMHSLEDRGSKPG